MPPFWSQLLLRCLPYAAAVALLAGIFVWGDVHRGAVDKRQFDAERARWTAAEAARAEAAVQALNRTLDTERAGREAAERANAKVTADLDAARLDARSLARRLFAAVEAARAAPACAVPATAGPAAEPVTAAAEPAGGPDLEGAIAGYADACARDAAALAGWQSFYADLQARYGR